MATRHLLLNTRWGPTFALHNIIMQEATETMYKRQSDTQLVSISYDRQQQTHLSPTLYCLPCWHGPCNNSPPIHNLTSSTFHSNLSFVQVQSLLPQKQVLKYLWNDNSKNNMQIGKWRQTCKLQKHTVFHDNCNSLLRHMEIESGQQSLSPSSGTQGTIKIIMRKPLAQLHNNEEGFILEFPKTLVSQKSQPVLVSISKTESMCLKQNY